MIPTAVPLALVSLLFISGTEGSSCHSIDLVHRYEWSHYKPATAIPDLKHPVKHIVFTHTNGKRGKTREQSLRSLRNSQDYAITVLGWPDLGHHFYIANDSRVYEGRGWHKVAQFSKMYNDRAITIAFIGNYYEYSPSKEAQKTAKKLMECGKERGYINNSDFHLHVMEDIECSANLAPDLQNTISMWKGYYGIVDDYLNCMQLDRRG